MDLADWRKRIDQIDRKLLALLNERAECVLQLAPLKRQQAIPIEEPAREAAIRSNLSHNNQGPLSHEAVCRIFESIIGVMKGLQTEDLTQEQRRTRREPSAASRAPKRSSRADLK
jgi:chorismate mutase